MNYYRLLYSKIWTPFVPPFLQEYTGHTESVNAVQWSPLGSNRYLARYNIFIQKLFKKSSYVLQFCLFICSYDYSCSDDQTAQILDIKKQAIVHRLESKTKPSKMTCLSFSSDGKLLATGNENGVVEIWNVHVSSLVLYC